MNQILSVNMPNNNKYKKPKQKASIKSVIIFFVSIIILFGIVLIVLAITNSNKSNSENTTGSQETQDKPRIDVTEEETEINILVSSNSAIDKIVYNWNDSEAEEVLGEQKTQVELNINIPAGTNTLKVIVTDINGNEESFEKEYTGADELNVEITLELDNENKINIVCKSESVIDKISYYLDDDEPTEISINDYKATISLGKVEGEHTLTVKVTDVDGKVTTKEADVYMTEITTTIEGNDCIIKVSNKRGISRLIISVNGEETEETVNNETDYETTIELTDGNNLIGISAYAIYKDAEETDREINTKKIGVVTYDATSGTVTSENWQYK